VGAEKVCHRKGKGRPSKTFFGAVSPVGKAKVIMNQRRDILDTWGGKNWFLFRRAGLGPVLKRKRVYVTTPSELLHGYPLLDRPSLI